MGGTGGGRCSTPTQQKKQQPVRVRAQLKTLPAPRTSEKAHRAPPQHIQQRLTTLTHHSTRLSLSLSLFLFLSLSLSHASAAHTRTRAQ